MSDLVSTSQIFRLLQAKTHEAAHHRCRDELRFVDEYGQPVAVQVNGRRPPRRRRSLTERHWEALRAMGLMDGQEAQGDGYGAG